MEIENKEVVSVNQQEKINNEIINLNNGGKLNSKELAFLLKQTFPTLTQKEYLYALMTCKAYQLDPRKKEIYFVPFNGKNGINIAPITSYEVYANEMNKAGYNIINEWRGDNDKDYLNLMIKSTIYKNGEKVYVSPWVSISEFAKIYNGKLSGLWAQIPTLMFEKCMLVRTARMILGKNMGYIYEEMVKLDNYKFQDQQPQEHKKNIELKMEELSNENK